MYYKLQDIDNFKNFASKILNELEIPVNADFEYELQSFLDEDTLLVFKEKNPIGKMVFDDYRCVFVLNQNNKDCMDAVKSNGFYNKFDYSKEFRKFMTKFLLDRFGESKADMYVEDFLDTNLSTNHEYKTLMTIVYENSKNKAMKKFIKEL